MPLALEFVESITLLHMVVVATALFWAWRRGHVTAERFPTHEILELTPEGAEELDRDD